MKPKKESKRGTTKTKEGEGGEVTRSLLKRKNTYIMKKKTNPKCVKRDVKRTM